MPGLTTYLVGQEQAGYRLSTGQRELAIQVLFPSVAVAEGSGIGHIKHDNTGRGIPIVESCHRCEALLPWEEKRILEKGTLRTSPGSPSDTLLFLHCGTDGSMCSG